MFSRIFRKKKVHPLSVDKVADASESVSATKDPDPEKSPEAGKQGKTPFLQGLLGRSQKNKPDSPKPKGSKKRKRNRWMSLLSCCTSENVVSSFTQEEQEKPQSRVPANLKKNFGQEEFDQDEVVTLKTVKEEPHEVRCRVKKRQETATMMILPNVPHDEFVIQQFIIEARIRDQQYKKQTGRTSPNIRDYNLSVDPYGFPNILLTCYMNSSLQSLLTLKDFVGDVCHQEKVWSPVPEAQLIKWFKAIRDAHSSIDIETKNQLLCCFKTAVSAQAPEFRDHTQKDAHEFLTSVLNQIRGLSPLLQEQAARSGREYSCPVEKHLLFKMKNIRTCKSCGVESRKTEEFTNLSVDVLPGGSVEEMIQHYQTERELNFKCECGGKVSVMRTEFETLPKVLILHLKRFSYSPSSELMKDEDPVVMQTNLMVSSKQDARGYSLVSVVSHDGNPETGHYICDGVAPNVDPQRPTDRWLSFNDAQVTHTSGCAVCFKRQASAYVLFYKRQE